MSGHGNGYRTNIGYSFFPPKKDVQVIQEDSFEVNRKAVETGYFSIPNQIKKT